MPSKAAERIYVEAALKNVAWVVNEFEEGESPDFIVATATGRIGVEVSQLFKDSGRRGSRKKEEERGREIFLSRCAKAYYRLGGPPLLVQANLPGAWIDRDPVALARVILSAVPARILKPVRIGRPQSAKAPQLRLTRFPDDMGSYSRWQCVNNRMGWVRTVGWSALEPMIIAKARGLERYRQAIDRVVLLVVADRFGESGMLQFDHDGSVTNNHGFHAVYWHEHPLRTVQIA